MLAVSALGAGRQAAAHIKSAVKANPVEWDMGLLLASALRRALLWDGADYALERGRSSLTMRRMPQLPPL
jgi:hypothetical protein